MAQIYERLYLGNYVGKIVEKCMLCVRQLNCSCGKKHSELCYIIYMLATVTPFCSLASVELGHSVLYTFVSFGV